MIFGLDRSASEIFEQALDQHSSERVRNAAWFYLSKMRFRRGDWQGATASLLRIEGNIDPRLRDEFNAMQVIENKVDITRKIGVEFSIEQVNTAR